MDNKNETTPLEIILHQAMSGRRPWIARITGTDADYGMSRSFVDGRIVRSTRRTSELLFSIAVPGIYQIGQAGSDTGFIVAWRKDGEIEYADTTEDRVRRYAELRDAGKSDKEARKESK